MQAHVQRMVDECGELNAKCTALGAFFSNPVFATLPEYKQELMREQHKHMTAYLGVLEKRIALERQLED